MSQPATSVLDLGHRRAEIRHLPLFGPVLGGEDQPALGDLPTRRPGQGGGVGPDLEPVGGGVHGGVGLVVDDHEAAVVVFESEVDEPFDQAAADLGLHGQLAPVAGGGQGPLHDRGGEGRPGEGSHRSRVLQALGGRLEPAQVIQVPPVGQGHGLQDGVDGATAGRAPLAPPGDALVLLGDGQRLVVAEAAGRRHPRGPDPPQELEPGPPPVRRHLRALQGSLGRDGGVRGQGQGQLGVLGRGHGPGLGLADLVEQRGVARVARLVVEADHEVVLGPGGGDVQQPALLGLLEALVGLADVEVAGGLEVVTLPPEADLRSLRAPGHDRRTGVPVGVEAGQHHHRELQALRAVHGHDAHRVVVGLPDHGLEAVGAALGLRRDPGHELGQGRAPGLDEGPRRVGQEPVTAPVVSGTASGQGQLDQPALPHHLGDQLVDRLPVPLAVEPGDLLQGRRHVVLLEALGHGPVDAPLAAGEAPVGEVGVGAAQPR